MHVEHAIAPGVMAGNARCSGSGSGFPGRSRLFADIIGVGRDMQCVCGWVAGGAFRSIRVSVPVCFKHGVR